MYHVVDNTGNEVQANIATESEAKVVMLYKYCTEELPRLSKILSCEDFKAMVIADKKTAFEDGYIEDYMRVEVQ